MGDDLALPDAQHSRYRGMPVDELLADESVHENTRHFHETN